MNNAARRVRINLASAPLRNRNLFYFLTGLLLLLILGSLLGSGLLYARYRQRNVQAQSELANLELQAETARTETAGLQVKSQEAARKLRSQVDFANEAIFLKSLSWTKFLAELETSLPPASYIVAMAPTPLGKGRVEVRLRVVFSGLDDMLVFINNLRSHSFVNIRPMSEERQAGLMVSEVSLSYEERR